MIDNNIDFSASRRKSVLAVKQIRDRNERLSMSMKHSRGMRNTTTQDQKVSLGSS